MPNIDIEAMIEEQLDKQAKTPEQAEYLKSMFRGLSKVVPPTAFTPTNSPLAQAPVINMFELTVALITAAFCIGQSPANVRPGNIRPHAVGLARSLFTDDGRFIQKNSNI